MIKTGNDPKLIRISLIVFATAFCISVSGQRTDYKPRIDSLQKNISLLFSSSVPDLYLESTDTLKNKNPFSYLWPVCALFQAENEMEALYPGKEFNSSLLKTISHYYDPEPPAPGYQAYVMSAGKDTRYYDDNQWIGITAADAYARTKNKVYLDLAVKIYRFMMTGYDTVSGGGIYWREGDKTTKNTCSNGPGIILALRLYQATHKKEYLKSALNIYNWTNKYLRSPQGIYYDALKVKTMRIDSAAYTYNTGTMLQSNVLLYNITSERKYLNEAQFIAVSAGKYFYKNKRLPNNYWFNAVMLRGFIELTKVDENYERLKFFADDAERIWANRDAAGLVGNRPGKTLIDQAAMLEIFARLQKLYNTIENSTFTNPLFTSGADPWIIYHKGYYYYTNTAGNRLFIRKAKNLNDLKSSESITIWTPPQGTSWSRDLWAPELHNIDGKWYMYFAADDGKNMNHRMYVLENQSPDPATGTWKFMGKISDPSDKWAIDGSVFEYSGKLYMVWSGWEGDANGSQNIYLARMQNPWTIAGQRIKISTPELPWETVGDLNNPNDVPHVNVNEGPVALQNRHKLSIIYSGSGCWTDSYCLGLLSYNGKGDILNPSSWTKYPWPVFSGCAEAGAFSPGHNCFFKSPDGKENWIMYHANPLAGEGCGRFRSPRAQKFTFRKDGMPDFGHPVDLDAPVRLPSDGKRKQAVLN